MYGYLLPGACRQKTGGGRDRRGHPARGLFKKKVQRTFII